MFLMGLRPGVFRSSVGGGGSEGWKDYVLL